MRKKILPVATLCVALASASSASEDIPKRALKTNYQLIDNQKQKEVNSFSAMLQEGNFYGRLRSNSFYYKWEKETASQENHVTSGLGGSLVYKSAIYNGFDLGAGLYYSHGFTTVSQNDAKNMKAGADVLNRFDYINTGSKELGVLGEAYIRYSGFNQSEIKIGRQIVETFYTKSNDTKMIPNTFEGVVLDTAIIPKTPIKLAYLTKEKLRAHGDTHSVLAWDDANSSSALKQLKWDQNDDSAMHRGLTYTKLKAVGKEDAPLIVGDLHNSSLENLKVDASFYVVPELIWEIMAEANYQIDLGSFSLSPGVRYIKQFDNKAGKIGGAAYDNTTKGYNDPDSLESQMFAARLVAKYEKIQLNLGYSKVFDEADLITPWRGFPTAGYTRSMARYNWMANTKSYRIELQLNNNKTGIYKDVFVQASVLHTDADENKGLFDENYYYVGFVQNLPMMPELQWRLRLGYNDTKKTDADSLDARFELNYLF